MPDNALSPEIMALIRRHASRNEADRRKQKRQHARTLIGELLAMPDDEVVKWLRTANPQA